MSAQTPAPPESASRTAPSPLDAVASLSRPVVGFVWTEKRGIALTALLYVLGLVVWSLNAARRDLGLGTAADLQYLVAGLVPALVLAVALALLVAWLRVPAWARDRLHAHWPEVARALGSLGAVMFAVGIFGYGALGWTGVRDRVPLLSGALLVVFFIGVVLVGLTREESWMFRFVWYVYAPLAIVFLVALAFAFYAEGIYPQLPQSLGGGRPRCVQLDVAASSLSAETLADIAPGATGDGTVRTARLDVVFTRGDTLYVQLPPDDRVVELRGGSIQAVVGCD